MATSMEEKKEFSDAFVTEAPRAKEQTTDEAFGLNLPEDAKAEAKADTAPGSDAPAGDKPAGDAAPDVAVVVVADEGSAMGEASGDAAAQANAAEANAKANEKAGMRGSESAPTTGEKEAAAAAGEKSTPAGEAGETPTMEANEFAPDGDEQPTDPKDIQRQKSWEGRLKAEEKRLLALKADLEAKAQATGQTTEQVTGDAVEAVATEKAADGDQSGAQDIKDVADQVKSGQISPEEAVRILSEDFGEEFVAHLNAIVDDRVSKVAGEKIGKVAEDVGAVIDHIKDSSTRAHFKAIQAAHPDFADIAAKPEFQQWAADNGKQDVVDHGDAEDINALLTEFKAAGAAPAAGGEDAGGGDAPAGGDVPADGEEPVAAPTDEDADFASATPAQNAVAAAQEAEPEEMDAAEGVRSAGLRLPNAPSKAADDDYAAAWKTF